MYGLTYIRLKQAKKKEMSLCSLNQNRHDFHPNAIKMKENSHRIVFKNSLKQSIYSHY